MDKLIQYEMGKTFSVQATELGPSRGRNKIEGSQMQNRRHQTRHRLWQVVSRLDRSILPLIAGLFLSVSAFAQTPTGPASSYPAGKQTMRLFSKQDKPLVDPQEKLIIDRMVAAGVLHPSSAEEFRRVHLFYSTLAGPPEPVFRVEDRKIPGPGSIPIRVYAPSGQAGLPLWVFPHGGDFVPGTLDAYEVPSRAVTNRCAYLVVPVGYRLALENPYPAAPEDAHTATKWVEEHAAEIDQNPKTPLSATPPGTFGLPPMPGSPQTPTSEANRAGGNIDLTTLATHFRVGRRFRSSSGGE
jgi:hypothetical protein